MIAAQGAKERSTEGASALLGRWLDALSKERRASPKTVEAYGRDLRQFLDFCASCGVARACADFSELSPADIRGFLAMRRESGVANRSLARQIAALRGFARFLERETGVRCEALFAIRAPKAPRSLPRPVAPAPARALCDPELGEDGVRDPGSRPATRLCSRFSMAVGCVSRRPGAAAVAILRRSKRAASPSSARGDACASFRLCRRSASGCANISPNAPMR